MAEVWGRCRRRCRRRELRLLHGCDEADTDIARHAPRSAAMENARSGMHTANAIVRVFTCRLVSAGAQLLLELPLNNGVSATDSGNAGEGGSASF